MAPAPKRSEYWFIFKNDQLLFTKNSNGHTLINISISEIIPKEIARQRLLAKLDDSDIYCAELLSDASIPDHTTLLPLRQALEILEPDWYELAAKAYAIINWDKNHCYCGRCGHLTSEMTDTFERICPACSLTFYPRISPSIIVLIHKNDQILMARGHHFSPGSYGLIAGFVEAGETIENAVHREVREEVGIKIKNLTYFGSQSWPFPDSLMVAFTAEYESGNLVINPVEIEDAGWYPINDLPYRGASSISIARKLVDHFVAEHARRSIK